MSVSLAACGSASSSAAASSSEEPAIEDIAGTYDLYACDYAEYTILASAVYEDETIQVVLNEDGTGSLVYDEDITEITEWTFDGETVRISSSGTDEAVECPYSNGVIIIDEPTSGLKMYFANESADVSSIEAMDYDQFMEALLADVDTSSTSSSSAE